MKLAVLFRNLLCFGAHAHVPADSATNLEHTVEIRAVRVESSSHIKSQQQQENANDLIFNNPDGSRVFEAIERHNSMLPVSRLPVEILSEVFLYFAPPFKPADADILPRRWLAFSQVCRAWRLIAVNDPRIWTRPFFKTPQLATEMIKRSGSLPLYIETNTMELTTSPEAVSVLISINGRQVRQLRFSTTYPRWDIFKWMACMVSTSFLEEISCSVLLSGSRYALPTYPVEDYRGIVCPHLRTLDLRSTPFLLQSPQPLTQLVSLRINGNGALLGGSVDLPTLIGVLQSSSLLEELYLYNALVHPTTSSHTLQDTGRILMSYLKVLSIHTSMEMLHETMRRLDLPSVAILYVGCAMIEDWSHPVDLNVHNKAPLNCVLGDIQNLSPSWTGIDPKILTIRTMPIPAPPLRSFSLSLTCSLPHNGADLSINIQAELSAADQHIFLLQLREKFSLNNLTDLILDREEGLGAPNYWKIYAALFSLTTLGAEGTKATEQLVDLLRKPLSTGPPFPNVTSILFSRVDANEEMLDKLGRGLSYRQKLGISLPKLTFARCPAISDIGLRQLMNHIPLVAIELTKYYI